MIVVRNVFPGTVGHAGGVAARRMLPAALLAATAAATANLALYAVARGLLGVPFVMPYGGPGTPSERLPEGMVVLASAVPAFAAAALLWGLGRVVRRPLVVVGVVAPLVLLASFSGPLSLTDTAPSTRVALLVMHVAAATMILGFLTASTVNTTGAKRALVPAARSHAATPQPTP